MFKYKIQKNRESGDSLKLFCYEGCFLLRGDADIFERQLEILDDRVEVGKAVLAEAHECVAAVVAVLQI